MLGGDLQRPWVAGLGGDAAAQQRAPLVALDDLPGQPAREAVDGVVGRRLAGALTVLVAMVFGLPAASVAPTAMSSGPPERLEGMRTLTVTEFVSLDGVMEAPGGEPGYAHAGWVAPHFTDELGDYKLQEQLEADVLLLGRVTYESFYGAWPHRDGPMAEKINSMRKVVASTTLARSDWTNTTMVGDGVPDAVDALKQEDGGPILVAGSRTLVRCLLAAGLVDQLNLQVFPLILGSGDRMFPEMETPTNLELLDTRGLASGVQIQRYHVT